MRGLEHRMPCELRLSMEITLLLLALLICCPSLRVQCAISSDHIGPGFSGSAMNFVDSEGVFLQSAGLNFSLSFHSIASQIGSYFLTITHAPSKQIVWTANPDKPLSSSDTLDFSSTGDVSLTNSDSGKPIWSTNTSDRGVTQMRMRDDGNLVLLDGKNETVWQSFDYPTDTLLSGQMLMNNESGLSSGPYSLSFDESGDLKLMYFDGSTSYVYWSMLADTRTARLSTGTPSYAVFNCTGLYLVMKDNSTAYTLTFQGYTLCRATLASDGSLDFYDFSSNYWRPGIFTLLDNCDLPLHCGPLGLCSSTSSAAAQCSCPASLQQVNKNDLTQGCNEPPRDPCANSTSASTQFEIIAESIDYFANAYVRPVESTGLNECRDRCSANCSCNYFFYENGSRDCILFSHLGTLQIQSNSSVVLYARSSDKQGSSQSSSPDKQQFPPFVLPVIIVCSVLIILLMTGTFLYWYFKIRTRDIPEECEIDEENSFLDVIPGLPARFSFKELQTATNNFTKKLGTGGFGSVYEGILPDKTRVAVKRLESIGQGKKEFRAEVAIIGSIHHIHLVHLRGFCAEGLHRLLVYEFMSNGSLDKHLFVGPDNFNVLDWDTRVKIALGTARGLAYLHEDCREKVIHCDIKPENILLDDHFNAKLSDFGLAKLIGKEQSQVFTTMRGTRGYLAPEWLMNLAISEKSDVYSFGMVLLEIISGRKNFEPSAVSEKRYFPAFAFDRVEHGSPEDLVDKRLQGTVSDADLLRVVRIALWCIQEDTTQRPAMAKVVQMLEGTTKIDEPPSSFAMQLHLRMIETLTSSQQSSSTSGSTSQSMLSAIQLSAAR